MGDEKAKCHGCFFCKSAKESDVIQRFGAMFPEGRAIAPTRSRYRRVGDAAMEERVILLPGYVFFELPDRPAGKTVSPADPDSTDVLQRALRSFSRYDNVLKLLCYTDGSWRLQGYDDEFARMLFESGGNIGISQAYFDEGRRIRILSGFLKDHEGSIVRVNRKARTVEVAMDLQGKRINLRLGYELVEPV